MATSKLQRYVSQQLSIHFGGYTIRENHRPEWLNTKNGGYLELDFFIEELDLAIEVQGVQHWTFVEHFHKDSAGYIAQIERDEAKKNLCNDNGISLIEIFCKDDLCKFLSNSLRFTNIEDISSEENAIMLWKRSRSNFVYRKTKKVRRHIDRIMKTNKNTDVSYQHRILVQKTKEALEYFEKRYPMPSCTNEQS